ncbi:uncharacterized protein LOC101852710 [Aplysia californica]|uniref:Uncharacterized protein LOC101852710 n=1 Tax=Aplysia californica TaxID=6500 RepID=A0ABM0JX28_APLCA|nr:uncharacterized protein LOC101852710 [Aplysia californica]
MQFLAVLLFVLPCALAKNICCVPDKMSGFAYNSYNGISSIYKIDFTAKKHLAVSLASFFNPNAFTLVDFGNGTMYYYDGQTCTKQSLAYPEIYQQCIPENATLVSEANLGPAVGGFPYKAYRFSVGPNTIEMAVSSNCLPLITRLSGPALLHTRTSIYINITTPATIDFPSYDLSKCKHDSVIVG